MRKLLRILGLIPDIAVKDVTINVWVSVKHDVEVDAEVNKAQPGEDQ